MYNLSTPIKVSFTTPGSSIMEFKGGSPSDTRADNVSNKMELSIIKLYRYDWTISNYSMIKPVPEAATSPIFDIDTSQSKQLKIILSPSSDDNVKIEVELSKQIKIEGLKLKETSNSSSKFSKNILDLEFLDSNGKTIDYYMGLPCEFKFVNTSKVFSWKKEENVSRFIQNDSLTIRVKLSVRYYSTCSQTGAHTGKIKRCTPWAWLPSTEFPIDDITFSKDPESSEGKSFKLLMKDMKTLFLDRTRFPDLVIKVGGQLFLAHKSILFTQCPHFAEMLKHDSESNSMECQLKPPKDVCCRLKEDYESLWIPNENADVFLSVLHFIYCGELYATDSVNDFAVYEFAKKYAVRELSMLLMPFEMHSVTQIELEKFSYTWYLKNFSARRKTGFSPIPSPTFKTSVEVDIEWNVVLYHMDSQNIILSLQRVSGRDTDVQTSFSLAVCKADGTVYEEREFKHLFTSNTISNCHPGLMNSVSRFLIPAELLFNDTLTVSCNLTVSNGGLKSELKHSLPGRYSAIDLTNWTHNLQTLLENETFADATLLVDGKEFKVHKAILSVRSPVFARMFDVDMEEKHSGCVRIEDISYEVMKQALLYIYTGKLVDLSMSHAPELYRTADKYEILDLKAICSEFIMENMNADSACEILILSDLYSDTKMKEAAKNLICRNAAQTLLAPLGFDLMKNHPDLAKDILESLSAAYCSLPPQNQFEKQSLKSPYRLVWKAVPGESSSNSNSVLRLSEVLKDSSISE